ncbi:MAG: hypothetical protein JO244_01490, partial [Solirubrobacterales bacterium]|nr:hypothetical protein [Solirubrobacterales bacterium]
MPGPTSARPHELAPDPLQHAAPDVELADEQIAFGDRTITDEEFAREEELVEDEIADERQEREAHAASVVKHERPSLIA